MCGRFALYSDASTLAEHFDAEAPSDWQPHYNIAPSQSIPIVRAEEKARRIAFAHWGLIPSWAKEKNFGYSTINARAETVAIKPAFRHAFRQRRCLIPADGFYEWQTKAGSKQKQPWFIVLRDREPMAFAGLWERWQSPEGELLESCCIIVTSANDLMRPIHERMPVILARNDWNTWLAAETANTQTLQQLLQPYPADEMTAWPVGTQVNNVRNDVADCMQIDLSHTENLSVYTSSPRPE